jgi:lipopolysaccharide transport system permease protein
MTRIDGLRVIGSAGAADPHRRSETTGPRGAEPDSWIENAPTKGRRALNLREVWGYRELVVFLAQRDLKARYKQAAFGVGWALVQPIVGVVVFTIVFNRLAGVSTGDVPYIVFALVGFLTWLYISSTVTATTGSLVGNAPLITKVYFPRLVAPLGALVPGMIDLAVGSGLVVGLMAYYGLAPTARLLALPLCLLGMMATALAVGLLLGTVNVRYRDVGKTTGFLIQLWLLCSPVAYPSDLVTGQWRWVYAVNPIVGVIDSIRWSVLATEAPGPELIVSAASLAILLFLALRYFARTERSFADVI